MKAHYDATTNNLKKVLGKSASKSIFRAVKIWTRPSSDGKSDATIMRTRLPEKAIDCALQSKSDIGRPNLFPGLLSKRWGQGFDITDSSASQEEQSPQATDHCAALQPYSLATWKSPFASHKSIMRS
jgi:hypothetical protein